MSSELSQVELGRQRPQRSCVGRGIERFADSSHSTGMRQPSNSVDQNPTPLAADIPNDPSADPSRSAEDPPPPRLDGDGIPPSPSHDGDASSASSRRDGDAGSASQGGDDDQHLSSSSYNSVFVSPPPVDAWMPSPDDAIHETIHINDNVQHPRQPPPPQRQTQLGGVQPSFSASTSGQHQPPLQPPQELLSNHQLFLPTPLSRSWHGGSVGVLPPDNSPTPTSPAGVLPAGGDASSIPVRQPHQDSNLYHLPHGGPHRPSANVVPSGPVVAGHPLLAPTAGFAGLTTFCQPWTAQAPSIYRYQRPLYHVGLTGTSPVVPDPVSTFPSTPSFGVDHRNNLHLPPSHPSSSAPGLDVSAVNIPPVNVPATPADAEMDRSETRKRSPPHRSHRRRRTRRSRSLSSSPSDSGSSVCRTLSSSSASSSGSESDRSRRHHRRLKSRGTIGTSDRQRRVDLDGWCCGCRKSKCRQKISLSDLNTLHNIAKKRKGADKFLGHKDRRSGATWVAIIKRTMKGYPDAAAYLWAELNCDDSVWRHITAGREAPAMCHGDYSDHLASLFRRVNSLYNNEEVRLRAEDLLHNLQQGLQEDVAALLDRAESIRLELANLGSEPTDRDMKRKIFDALHSERLRDRIDDYLTNDRVSLRRFMRKLLEQDSRQRHRDHRYNAKHSAQLNVTTTSSSLPGGATTSTTPPGGTTTSSFPPGGTTTSSFLPGGTTTSSFLPGGTTTSSFLPGGTTTSPSLPGDATTSTLATYPESVAAAAWPQRALMIQPAATHAQQPRRGASSTAMYLDSSAVRPPISGDGSAADSKHFTIEFVRRFRCQRCLVHDHSTSKCAADKMFMAHLRCDQCGLHHDVSPNKALHCAKAICHRCSAAGHLCRACPAPKPLRGRAPVQPQPGTAQVNCLASASAASSSLITIDLKISADDELLSPTVLCPALLDTGAEAFFLRSDELSSWRTAGLHFPILPDSTKVKVANGTSVPTLGRTPPLRVTFVSGTTISASFLILEDLTHRAILPTAALRQAGGARWVVGETASEDRIFIGDAQVQQHSLATASPGSVTCLRMVVAKNPPTLTEEHAVKFSVLQENSEHLHPVALPIDRDDPVSDDRHLLRVSYRPDASAPAGRPYVDIPWCDDDCRPAWNYHRAYARDKAIFSRLTSQQQQLYRQAVNDLVAAGFAEIVDDPKQCGYYINGLPVFRPDKATHPCRVCLDARELNRYLANISSKGVGPGSLWFFLLAIRNCKFFRAADLQTAFLRVGLHDSDSFFIGCVAASMTIRFKRLPFGLSCSGFGLESVLEDLQNRWSRLLASLSSPHGSPFSRISPMTSSTKPKPSPVMLNTQPMCSLPDVLIKEGLDLVIYVDDLANRGEHPADVHHRSVFCYSKLDDSGLPVHEVKTFDNIHPAPSLDPANVKGLLGYRYDPGSDSLSLSIKLEATYSPQSCTRRLLVGAVNSFYDPLNLFMEFAAVGRGLARLASQPTDAKIPPWDVPLDPTLIERLNKWISHIPRDLWVPRFAGLHQGVYAFTDASYDGFCCDIRAAESPFTRLCGRFGLFSLDCVHKHSIVQKELSGLYCTIILLDRLLDVATVHGPLPPTCDVFTDSLIAIHRLRSIANDSKLGIFERRRLRRVRDFVDRAQKLGIDTHVRHVAGVHNPADPSTRPFRDPVELLPLSPDQIGIGVSSSLASHLTYPRLSRPAENGSDDDLTFDPIPLIDGADSDVSCELNVITSVSNNDIDTNFVSIEDLQADQESSVVIRAIKEKLTSNGEDTSRQRLSNWYRVNGDDLLVRILGAKISDEDCPVAERIEQVLIGTEPLKHKLVEKAHDAFHRGKGGTFRLLSTRYYWKRMRAYVRRFVNRCEACAKAKGDRIARCSLSSVPWCGGVGPLRVLMIDYSGPHDGAFSGGQDPSVDRYAVTVVCVGTRYCRGVTVPDKSCATLLPKLSALFDSTDWPSLILASDSTFRGHQWVHFCASNNILYKELPANAPFLLGSGERPHKEVNGYMRVIFGKLGLGTPALSWVRHYFHGLRAWNLLPLPGSDIAPHDLVYLSRGRVPSLDPVDHSAARQVYQGLPSIVSALSPDILADIQNVKVSRWQQYRQVWLDLRERVRSTMATRSPPLSLLPGDMVYVWGHPRSKLSFRWNGPFEVISASPGSTVLTVLDEHGAELLCARDNCKAAPAEGSSSTARDPVPAEGSSSAGRDPVPAEGSSSPGRDPVPAEGSSSAGRDPVPAEGSSSTCRNPPPVEDSSSVPRERLAPSAPRVPHSPDLGSLHVGMDVVAFFVPEDDAFGTDQQDGARWYFGRLLSLDEEIPMIVIAPYCRRSDGLPVSDGEEYLAADSYLDHDSPTVIDLRSSFAVVRRITRATLRMLAAEVDGE